MGDQGGDRHRMMTIPEGEPPPENSAPAGDYTSLGLSEYSHGLPCRATGLREPSRSAAEGAARSSI